MARVALALVELGHEGDRHPLLVGDLLGAVLVDRVLVRGLEHGAVGEVDLVLAEVALALGVLDPQPGAGHAVADPADQRLDARGAEHRVVDVVEVRGGEVAVAERRRLVVGVLEDHELELGRADGGQPALGEPVELRRGGSGAARRRPGRRPPTAGRPGTSRCPRATGRAAACRSPASSRSRRSRAPTTTSRSRRRCSSRRRRRAGSCTPRRRGSTTSSRKWRAVSRLPCSRPCMSVRHSRTVSMRPASTSARRSSSERGAMAAHRTRAKVPMRKPSRAQAA